MDRRESLKLIAWSTVSSSLLLSGCKPDEKKEAVVAKPVQGYDRMAEEKKAFDEIMSQKFFSDHEMATITLLSDFIIPADDVSGSASQAKVPDFIEFMAKDRPELQLPLRGGLRWTDMQTMKQYGHAFTECSLSQQTAFLDQIAYPDKAKVEMKQGVSFFTLMRNLTASGFFSSEMGIKDVGYQGNRPTQWNGVPDDVLRQYGLSIPKRNLTSV